MARDVEEVKGEGAKDELFLAREDLIDGERLHRHWKPPFTSQSVDDEVSGKLGKAKSRPLEEVGVLHVVEVLMGQEKVVRGDVLLLEPLDDPRRGINKESGAVFL